MLLKSTPKYTVNLDDKPSIRWNHILNENKKTLLNVKKQLFEQINLEKYYYIVSFLIQIYKIFGSISYLEEIDSIAKIMEIDFNFLLIMQLIYEVSASCTSVITNVDNKQTFFRTMDWPMTFLKDITIDVDFIKNNKIIYKATTWIGYVGILTATVPYKYSLAINYRKTNNVSFTTFLKKFYKLSSMNWPIGYLIRNVCENNLNYDVALNILCKANLISPCYITICDAINIINPIVITRDPSAYKIYKKNYIIQTNCDQNKYTPNILFSVERKKTVKKIIKNHNNKFKSNDELINACFIYPVINYQTIYYTIMCPSTNTHYSVIIY
jgi:acid ceramidase